MTDVLVGYPVRSRLADGDAVAEDENGDRVRLVRIAQGDARAEAALEAWLAVDGAHVQRLLDLGWAPNGDLVAVVADVPIALVDLLAAAPLNASEAVTVLIPVAEALADLHAAGVAHGAVGAAAIGLTRAGAPVLLMPRTATAADRGGIDPSGADLRALVDLARRLLPPPLPEAVAAALERDPGGAGVDGLFRLADPRPVLLQRGPGSRGTGTPARLVEPASATVERQRAGVPPVRAAAIAARLHRAVAAVRPRVWVAAAASLASLTAALLLLPGHGAAVRAYPIRSPSAAAPPARSPSPAAGTTSAPPGPGSMDPVRAATALLDARARCLTSAAVGCLDAVDAPGSPVDAADRAALVAGVDAVRPPGVAPVLLSASGSTAVLAVGPDTVLEIREPGGWRLRDVIAPTAARAQMPSEPSKSPSSSRARTAERKRAASAPSTIRWS